MIIELNKTEYRFSHGKDPRGFGSWAFSLDRDAAGGDPGVFWAHQSTYAAAAKLARKHFASSLPEHGLFQIFVLP